MRAAARARSIQAPAEKRVAEIIDAIVEEVGDPKDLSLKTLIDDLRKVEECEQLTGNRKKNRDSAERLRKDLDAIKGTLKAAPPELVSFLFEQERFWTLFLYQRTGPRTVVEIDPDARKFLSPTPEPEHLKTFLGWIDWLRARCDQADKVKPGEHGGIEYQQQLAAIASRYIMESLGLPLSGSREGKYCKVASLLFEAMTGEYDHDLRRACSAVGALKHKK